MRGYLAAREFGRPGAYRVRTACLSQLSRIDEAKAAHAEFLRLGPDATVTSTTAQVPLKQPEDIKRYIDALKQAGLRDQLIERINGKSPGKALSAAPERLARAAARHRQSSLCRLVALLSRRTHAPRRQLSGQLRSRQLVVGAAVHDPTRTPSAHRNNPSPDDFWSKQPPSMPAVHA